MENNLDSPSFGNFSIQDTMEMGMGNSQLLNDLMGPDSATANPDDVQDINNDDAPAPAPAKQTAAPAKKTAPAATTSTDDNEDDSEKKDPSKSIEDFLLGDEDEDENDSEDTNNQSVKKTKTTTEDNVDGDDEDGEDSAPNQFAALSKDLLKLGVFSQDDEDEDVVIDTPEAFLDKFQAEKKKGAIEIVNNFISQFGEEYQQAFDSIFVKGVSPKDYFGTFNNIQSFTDMDLTDEANQVAVIKQALLDQGFESEDITTEIERFKNYGDLETVATKHHKVLIKKEAAKLQELEQQRTVQLQQQAAIKQEYYTNVNKVLQDKLKAKEFDGIPLNPKLAGELQDFLVTDKYKTNSGETLTDFDKTILELKRPENHEKKVKIGLLLKILEKDPTLSTIQKTGLTKKSNELFGEVARQAQKSSVKSKAPTNNTSWFQ